MKRDRFPKFRLETVDGLIQLPENEENEKIIDLVFEIAFKLIDLAKVRLEDNHTLSETAMEKTK